MNNCSISKGRPTIIRDFSQEFRLLSAKSAGKLMIKHTTTLIFFLLCAVSTANLIYVMLQVKDTGCGISPQDMPHTFAKFAHPQNATMKSHGGNGLGLALSRRYT